MTEYYKLNKEKFKEAVYRYKAKNWSKILLISAKSNAKKRGMEFSLVDDDIVIPDVCPIFKFPLTRITTGGRVDTNPSLDRIDNSKGYMKENIWVISWKANRAKSNLTIEELKLFAKAMLEL